jgi:hypothetical protein
MTVAKEPGHRGEREVTVKTIARGMPAVVTNSCAFYYAHEAAGASGAGHSLRPLILRRRGSNLAQTCGEIAKLCLPMTLLEIDSVAWAKGALAPCPPSIGSLILNGGHASTFALRATADAFAHPAHRLSSSAKADDPVSQRRR